MKKIFFLVLVLITLIGLPSSSYAGCSVPLGKYQYLFSDGNESWFFNSDTTVRVDKAGNKIFQHGDFSVNVNGYTYQRVGNIFTFVTQFGQYKSNSGGPIYFYPSEPQMSMALAYIGVGASYDDKYFGTYIKQGDGNVIFTPKRKLAPLVISAKDCGGYKSANLDYKTVSKELGIVSHQGYITANLNTDILFDYNSAAVLPKAADQLNKLAFAIQNQRQGFVVLRGHTDSKGTDAYNLDLSKKRAQSVASWLNVNGAIPSNVIQSEGYGEEFPVAANDINGLDNPSGRAKNRRVEVLIQTVQGAALPQPTSIVTAQPVNTGEVYGSEVSRSVAGDKSTGSYVETIQYSGGNVESKSIAVSPASAIETITFTDGRVVSRTNNGYTMINNR